MTTLVLEFKKIESDDKAKYSNFYMNPKAETIINESDNDDAFLSIYISIISKIQKFLGKDLSQIIDSVLDQTINISKNKPLSGSSYIELPKNLDHQKTGLINIQNVNDKECFKWCLVGYVYIMQIIIQEEIEKLTKTLQKKLTLKIQNFPSNQSYSQNRKKKKKNYISINVFGYENKEEYPI